MMENHQMAAVGNGVANVLQHLKLPIEILAQSCIQHRIQTDAHQPIFRVMVVRLATGILMIPLDVSVSDVVVSQGILGSRFLQIEDFVDML